MLLKAATLACALVLYGAAAGCGATRDAPSPVRSGSVVIWAVGDGGVDNAASRAVVRLIEHDRPARVIYLGDVYEAGTAREFAAFGQIWRPLLKRAWPVPGNHDWPNHRRGYDRFWASVHDRAQPAAYTRRVVGWTLIAANSEDLGAAQRRRLRRQAAGGGNCRIAFWHRPRFNAGEHRDEQGDVDDLWRAIRGRAAILLSGHDHNMQRFKPVGGTVQYVSGAGGKSHYAVDNSDPRLAFSDSRSNGALRLALSRHKAQLRFVSTRGTVLDTSTVTCAD
jgi:hypothetical protein